MHISQLITFSMVTDTNTNDDFPSALLRIFAPVRACIKEKVASPTVKEREDDVMQYEAAVGQRSLGDFGYVSVQQS